MAFRLAAVALCVLASISTSALAATAPPPAPSALAQEIASAAIIEENLYAALYNITAQVLNMTGLSLALGSGANLTLLAPNDDAWHNVTKQPRGAELMRALKGPDKETVLINTLLYHVVPTFYTSATLLGTTSNSPLPTLLGDAIFISTANGASLFYTNSSNIKDFATDVGPDLFTDYIVSIQGIDKVLIPTNISLLYTPVTLIAVPAAPAPAGAPAAAPTPTATPTAVSPPPTSSAPRTPPPASSSSGNATSPSTPGTISSAGFVAVNAVATFAALLVSVAALL